ncbi:MAG: GGDEF domain-containing protein [Pseudomonadota bacterium]
MARAIEQSHRIAEVAIGALKQLELAASPRNIEVWLAHVAGENPALSHDIQKALQREGSITQKQADELYNVHIMRGDLSNDVIEIVARFEKEVSELTDAIELSGESAQGHGEQLRTLSFELGQSADSNPRISELLEGVISVARSIRKENKTLENRLAESSDEVLHLKQNLEHVQMEAMIDSLTGVKNRRTFDEAIKKQLRAMQNHGDPLALILADIDHFKSFNDRWGHQTGDQVLRLVAEVMNANVKGQDLLARYGGEEFAIILPGTSLENAEMLANRIRRAVEARRLKKRRTDEDLGVITMSMGAVQASRADTVESLVERADKCLYAAKHNGRNQVMTERSDAESASQATDKTPSAGNSAAKSQKSA